MTNRNIVSIFIGLFTVSLILFFSIITLDSRINDLQSQHVITIRSLGDRIYTLQQRVEANGHSFTGLQQKITEDIESSIQKNHQKILLLNASIDPKNFRWSKIKKVREAVQETVEEFRYPKHMDTKQLTEFAAAIVDWGDKFDVSISLLLAVSRRESAFNPKAVSKANAQGLLQIIPPTAEDIASALSQRHYSMFKIQDNVKFAAYYLMTLLDMYDRNTETSLQAYNCGPTCVSKVKSGEFSKFPSETENYVRLIISDCVTENEDGTCSLKGFLKYYQDKGL